MRKYVVFALFALVVLFANENADDSSSKGAAEVNYELCDSQQEKCISKCDEQEEGTSECYEKCDKQYDKCLNPS